MAVASPVVHVERCLSQVPGYRPETKHRLLNEIPALLNQMVSLKCQVAVLEEGRPTSLVQLFGTIPIYYKSVQYNIPVVIWILETYPVVPPKCYVTPTPDMRIKERHRHVDQNGLVYLPYLHGWKPAQSNLDELVSFMSSVFSDDPPVYRYEPPAGSPPPALPVAKQPAVKPISPRPANPSPPPVSVPAPKPHASVIQNDVTATAVKKEKLVNAVTSKLQATLTDFNKQFQRELDGLFEKQQRLNAGSASIADAIAALKKEQEVLRASVETVSAKSAELSKWLAENESSQELDVDSAVLPQTVWARQLFEAVSGDSAIEDTLYELDNAFRDERLDLQTYLKQIRKLARAQFFHRALALKIVEKQTQISSQQQRIGQMM